MKSTLGFFLLLALSALGSACTSCQQEEVQILKPDGVMTAYISEIDANVNASRSAANLNRIELDSLQLEQLSTEYPNWNEVALFSDSKGLRYVQMTGSGMDSERWEQLFFNKEGKLIYAERSDELPIDSGLKERYYFILDKLVRALDGNGKEENIESNKIKVVAIGLVNEARQLRNMHNNKPAKP